MTKLSNFFLLISSIFLLYGCSENTTTQNENTLISVSYTPVQEYLISGRNLAVEVLGHYSDGTALPLNETLQWTSSDTQIATVTNGNIGTSALEGNVTITYSSKDRLPSGEPVISNALHYEVVHANLLSINITPFTSDIYVGEEIQLPANGTFEVADKNITSALFDLVYTTSDASVLSVTSDGKIKAVAEGSATITLKDATTNIFDTITLTVTRSPYKSIKITSPQSMFNVQETIALEAIGTNEADVQIIITDSVVWKSSDTEFVTIDAQGIATANKIGESNISASLDSITSNTILLKVDKDTYLRLSDMSDEEPLKLSFPYICNYNMSCKENILLPTTNGYIALKKFTLEALGKDFTITNVNVTAFDGITSQLGSARFNGLSNAQIISKDTNVTFTIESLASATDKELVYSFGIDGEPVESFKASYLFKTQ